MVFSAVVAVCVTTRKLAFAVWAALTESEAIVCWECRHVCTYVRSMGQQGTRQTGSLA